MSDVRGKYKAILSRERSWAFSVARAGVKPRPISVWEVLIPVLLVFLYVKSRSDREVMVRNLLFTKEEALKAALGMVEEGAGLEEAMSPVIEKTRGLLESVQEGLYSEEIRQEQLKEVRILANHYFRLLRARGEDYDALVLDAYKSRGGYMDFLGRLKAAEEAVNQAALRTLGPRGDPALVGRMEEAYERLRFSSAERIFGPAGMIRC